MAKQMVTSAVKTQEAFIDSSEAMVSTLNRHCNSADNIHLTDKSKTTILVNDIPRYTLRTFQPFKVLRRIHCIKVEQRGTVLTRRLVSVMDALEVMQFVHKKKLLVDTSAILWQRGVRLVIPRKTPERTTKNKTVMQGTSHPMHASEQDLQKESGTRLPHKRKRKTSPSSSPPKKKKRKKKTRGQTRQTVILLSFTGNFDGTEVL